MSNPGMQTIEEIVPDITARVVLKGAMDRCFPDDRENIEQHLHAFGVAVIRYSRIEPDTKSLQRYFRKTCGWNEFQALWFRVRIEKCIKAARSTRKLENRSE